MLLRLKEILFNHDSSSASTDAFNIRKNEKDFLDLPEWRGVSKNPKDSPAAYARLETQGKTLTIQANFIFDGPDQQDVLIRALDANFHHEEPFGSNLSKLEVELLEDLKPKAEGNVLGRVQTTPLTHSPGETGLKSFKLEDVRIQDAGVGVHDIVWRWQFQVNGTNDWIDLAVTTHRIYTVVQVPKKPWLQDHKPSNTQLPWIEVLDKACDWAAGAKDPDLAAEKVTSRVHQFGEENVICYRPTGATYYTDHRTFDCSSFLALLRGEEGKGKGVNCDDCAAIVSTFANSVGCDLEQMCIRPIEKSAFRVNPHMRIGVKGTQVDTEFFHHMVAAEDGCGTHVEVFDACLKIGDPAEPTTFTLPTNLPFTTGQSGYHVRLVFPAHQSMTQIHPCCKRRPLGSATGYPDLCTDPGILKEHFEFGLWTNPDVGPTVFVSEFFFGDYLLSSLCLTSLQKSDPGSTPSSIQTLWKAKNSAEGTLFRIDLYENTSRQVAREGVMIILGALQAPGLVRPQIADVGDVMFADPAFEEILFAAGNLVFYLRNVCDEIGSLIDVGRLITKKILSPPDIIEEPLDPNVVKRFSFPSGDAAVGKRIRLREEPAHPFAPRRFYQYFADAGEVSLEDGTLVYLPRTTGEHLLKIFAVDADGKGVLQTLRLTVKRD